MTTGGPTLDCDTSASAVESNGRVSGTVDVANPELHVRQRAHATTAIAAVVLICLSSGPYISIWRWWADVPLSTESWPYVVTMWIPTAIASALFVHDVGVPRIAGRHGAVQAGIGQSSAAPALLATLAAWVVASTAWTTSSGQGPRQAVLSCLVIATGAWFGLVPTFRQQVAAVWTGMHVLTVGSLVAVIASSSARSSTFIGDRSWIGLFGNPNLLGPVATGGLLVTVGVWPLVRSRLRVGLVLLCVVDIVVAAAATSVTAWLALVAGLLTILSSRTVRGAEGLNPKTQRRWLAGTATAVVTACAMLLLVLPLAGLVGKDATLSGRTVVWSYVLRALDGRWLHGFGFAAFWDDPGNQAGYITYSGRDWVASSHSTFVDTLVWLGVVGLALLVTAVAAGLGRLWWFAVSRGGWEATWWCGMGAFALIENLAESMWLLQSTFWMLLLSSTVVASRWCGRSTMSACAPGLPQGQGRSLQHPARKAI